MKRKLFEFIFFIVCICIMVMSLNMAIADASGMSIHTGELLGYTVIIVLLSAVIIKYPIILAAVGIIMMGGGLYAYINHSELPMNVINYLMDFFRWLPQYIAGYITFDLRYSLLFAILYILFVNLIIALIVFSKKWYGVLIVLGTAAFAFFWFIYVEKARLYLFYFLFAALMAYSYNVYERKKQEWLKAESNIDKNIEVKWVMNSFAIIVIALLVSQFLALNVKPLQWNWLSEKALQAFPFIESWRNDYLDSFGFGFGSKYGIDEVGYKTARLGGPVVLSEKVMLTLETDATENLYLRGTVKDYYSGSSWGRSKKNNYEYSTGMELPLPFSAEVDTYDKSIRITHQNLTTSTIFAPNTLAKVQHKFERFFMNEDSEVAFPRTLAQRDSYTVTYEAPYVDVKQLRSIKTKDLSPDLYRQLPPNITPRVRQLALDITARSYNDYDKAKAIERYLRNNYKYTLKPSELPKNREFVDYFLFEDKEGYCTYFATSLAVLLRAVDIPCRYVEGFLAKPGEVAVNEVAGTDAHAWVEVNFGQYGWLTFEATPAYPLIGYRNQGEVPAAPIPVREPDEPAVPAAPVESDPRIRDQEPEDEDEGNTSVVQRRKISPLTGIFLVIFAILLLRIVYLLLKDAYTQHKLKIAHGRQYASIYIKDIIGLLAQIEIDMQPEETLREYWFKVKHILAEEYEDGDRVLRLLEKMRYSEEILVESDKALLEAYRKKLKKFVTARLGIIKALINRYIIGL